MLKRPFGAILDFSASRTKWQKIRYSLGYKTNIEKMEINKFKYMKISLPVRTVRRKLVN